MLICDKTAEKLIFEEVNFSIEEELDVILIKRLDVESHIKGYHVYMNEWTPEIGEILKTCLEPKNVVDRFAVAVEKEGQIVGHLNKENSGRFAKTIFYFVRANHGNACQVEVRRKRVNIGDGQGVQVPFTLQFSGEEKYIKILKNSLPCLLLNA